jgi:hypothetical protein
MRCCMWCRNDVTGTVLLAVYGGACDDVLCQLPYVGTRCTATMRWGYRMYHQGGRMPRIAPKHDLPPLKAAGQSGSMGPSCNAVPLPVHGKLTAENTVNALILRRLCPTQWSGIQYYISR